MSEGKTSDGAGGSGEMDGSTGGNPSGGGQKAQKPSQVFLRNLPLSMLEPDIETMLADCGPIKRIDLIKTMDKETRVKLSRGFGFVTFALEEDAVKAVQTIHGKSVMGRTVSCEIALKKGAKREGNGHQQQGQSARSLAATGAASTGEQKAPVTNSYGGSSGKKAPPVIATTQPASDGAEGDTEMSESKTESGKKKKAGKEKGGKTKTVKDGDSGGGAIKAGAAAKVSESSAAAAEAATGNGDTGDSAREAETMVAGQGEGGLSKKALRKAARKAMKKELKRKAKERARETKEKESRAALEEDTTTKSGSSDINATPMTQAGRGDGGGDRKEDAGVGEEEVLDPKAAKMQRDSRTVLIFGVADDLTAKQLQKRVKKCATVTALTLEDNDGRYLPVGRVARVECDSKESVRKIIAGIDSHTVHGKTLRARRLLETVPGHDVRHQKQQRLIVRNLNFNAKEEDLAMAFCDFGPLNEVHIPTVKVTSQRRVRGSDEQETVTENRSRGFGFVQFLCPKDAARVVKDHGVLKICGRDAAVDYSITKEKYDTMRQQQKIQAPPDQAENKSKDKNKNSNNADSSGEDESVEDDDDDDDDEEGGEGRVKKSGTSESGMDDDDDDDDNDDDDGDDEAEEGGPDAGAGLGRTPRAAAAKKKAPDVQHGCTVFVRNVAFDCGEDEVRERFGEFGSVKLALLVKDRATGMPRGTAFVKFGIKEDADRCLAGAMGAMDPAHAKDTGGSCIYLGSRALHVTRAVDREEAGRLTVGAQKRVGHKDKRNLYLADEGLVMEDSSASEGAAKNDMDKRVQARRDKKSKLKNPIFFVSPVRLSVRNLARHVTDAKLKAMAAAAAREGLERGRANPQDVRRYLEAQGEEFAAITPKRLQIPPVSGGAVVKSKIIRDMDKKPNPDDPSQLHPSKGYGFVEFANHGQALAALRQLNNNPAYSSSARSEGVAKGESSRLIVEFSVENHAMIKLQQGRKEAFEQRKRELKALGLGQDGRPIEQAQTEDRRKRGKIQREKKRKLPTASDAPTNDHRVDLDEVQTAAASAQPSPTKKRKTRKTKSDTGEDRAKRENATGAVPSGDPETDALVGGLGTEGEDRPKKKKKKKKASKFERLDDEERAYQKLEREYTNKTTKAMTAGDRGASNKRGVEGERKAAGDVDGGEAEQQRSSRASKKGKKGRWFD